MVPEGTTINHSNCHTGNSDIAMEGAGVDRSDKYRLNIKYLFNKLSFELEKNEKVQKYLSVIIIFVVVVGGIQMGAGLPRAIDMLSLIFVIGVAIAHAIGAKDGENRISRFGDGCVRGGWLGFLVGVTLITGTDFAAQMDFSVIMPAMSVALLAPLYGYFFKIITMQLE